MPTSPFSTRCGAAGSGELRDRLMRRARGMNLHVAVPTMLRGSVQVMNDGSREKAGEGSYVSARSSGEIIKGLCL